MVFPARSLFFAASICGIEFSLIYKYKCSHHDPNHIIQKSVAFYKEFHKVFTFLDLEILYPANAVLFLISRAAERCKIMCSHKVLRYFFQKRNIKRVWVMQCQIRKERILAGAVQYKIKIFLCGAGVPRVKIGICFFTAQYGNIIGQQRIHSADYVSAGDFMLRFKGETVFVGMNSRIRPRTAVYLYRRIGDISKLFFYDVLDSHSVFLSLETVIRRSPISSHNFKIPHSIHPKIIFSPITIFRKTMESPSAK